METSNLLKLKRPTKAAIQDKQQCTHIISLVLADKKTKYSIRMNF